MLKLLSSLLLGNYNAKVLRRIGQTVEAINALEPSVRQLDDAQLRAKTDEFKARLAGGAALEDILPEAFAVVREAAVRTIGQRHFDVQLVGGVVLHEGNIAEMKTGEGKTLVATLPLYLNALTGRGVHLVTVNDYLARRDAEWMGPIYRLLGLTVGVNVHGLDFAQKKAAYRADVTYGTNNEFGFDYLRDNMATSAEHLVQRPLYYAIVDEVDSILIDEARTPLIISGAADKPTDLYYQFARIVPRLRVDEDYTVDEKAHTAHPTEQGIRKVEKLLGIDDLFDHEHMDLSHYLYNALKAHALMKRDRDYVVKDGEVIIVDEFTGRLMFGRRYSDGLHQAIEAKEGVKIERESQTLATITLQNYFRMYEKLAGMTGTAATEEEEFRKIYGTDVVVIPTHRPMIRADHPDVVYRSERGKFRAVVDEIAECYARGQPVLVGTVSIEKSERLSALLKQRGIPHQVLNAKYHEKEAEIIAQAGRLGTVTIATNMAGRGTDIMLGGNPEWLARKELLKRGYSPEVVAAAAEKTPTNDPEVLRARREFQELFAAQKAECDAERQQVIALGGLHIIGTERHEARRIDNQLRGRSGRQGDPGSSRFYIALEDDLMRLFGSDNIAGLLDRIGFEEDMPIEHNLLTRAIENAQKRVESRNFDIRRRVLEYDDVMNKQREVVYRQRRQVLFGDELQGPLMSMVEAIVDRWLDLYCEQRAHPEDWDLAGLIKAAEASFVPEGRLRVADLQGLGRAEVRERLLELAREEYAAKERDLGPELMREFVRAILLRVVDQKWMDHLDAMDTLREGIGLRAYGQKDPLIEYKMEAFDMFQATVEAIQEDAVKYVYRLTLVREPGRAAGRLGASRQRRLVLQKEELQPYRMAAGLEGMGPVPDAGHGREAAPAVAQGETSRREPVRVGPKVGRNDPCPCGSGKKYKKCCGRNA